MSVVSSILSTRTPGWRISVRLASLMDSVFAIGFGLGLRFVVDTVSHHDFKLTGTLVGLWEGVILLHFLKKMPKSSDPYIAYGVRLFVDFLFTESVARLVLVLIWTALGMVLADVTPAIWDEVGLKRIWKRFRRDIYTLTQMIPTVAFFPPARTVRFSPSRAPSVVSEARSGIPPSVAPTGMTPTTTDAVPPSEPPPAPRRQVVKRRLPGYFSMDTTDTETDSGSVVSVGTFGGITGRTSRRLSVYPGRVDFDSQSSTPSQNDLDEGNISDTSSNITERAPYSGIPDPESIPDMELEEPLLIDVTAAPVKHEDGEVTPKGQKNFYMPPTPSDSAARWPREVDEAPLPVPSGSMPEIPDFLEESNTEDWEKIQRADYTDDNEKPPTPPAKDDLPAAYKKVESNTPPDDLQNWDTMESQIISPPLINNENNAHDHDNNNNNITTDNNHEYPEASTSAAAANRQSQPPPYDDYDNNELDDIYVSDPPRQEKARFEAASGDLLGGDNEYGVPPPATNGQDEQQQRDLDDVFGGGGGNRPLSDLNFGASNPWGRGFAAQTAEVEAVKLKEMEEEAEREREKWEKEEQERIAAEEAKRVEEEERKRKEEEEKKIQEEMEALQRKKEAEEAAKREKEEKEGEKEERKRKRAEEKEEKKRKAEEKAERLKKEAEDEAARQKKREEEAEAARVKEEEEKKKAEAKRKAEEEEEKKREEEAAEAKRLEELEKQKAEAERKAREDQLERARVEQEEEKQRRKQAAAESEEALKKAQEEEDKAARDQAVKSLADEISPEDQAADEAAAEGRKTPTPNDPQPPETEPEQPVDVDADADADAHGEDEHVDQERHVESFLDAESVITEGSEVPSEVKERLHKLLLMKAQIFETEARLEELKGQLETQDDANKANVEENIRAMEKVLRKYHRKEARRANAVPEPTFLGAQFKADRKDMIMCDLLLGVDNVETKIEEKLESMLQPGVRSLQLMVKVPTGQIFKKLMQNVTKTLTTYRLLDYVVPDKANARNSQIDISEEEFGHWLASYRQSVTRAEEDEGGIWSQS